MKTALISRPQQSSGSSETLSPQAERTAQASVVQSSASRVYDLEVLICRLDDGETRARAANLPLPESRSATVREAMQTIIESARRMISDCTARDGSVPWVVPSAAPEDNESRFVVPLVM